MRTGPVLGVGWRAALLDMDLTGAPVDLEGARETGARETAGLSEAAGLGASAAGAAAGAGSAGALAAVAEEGSTGTALEEEGVP